MSLLTAGWQMLAGHFVADYAMQIDFIGKFKNPWVPIDLSRVPPGQAPQAIWFWVLTAHAAVHALAVQLATGSVLLGTLELVAHWLIDLAKCAGWTGIHTDQMMHLVCKLLWLFLLWYFGGLP